MYVSSLQKSDTNYFVNHRLKPTYSLHYFLCGVELAAWMGLGLVALHAHCSFISRGQKYLCRYDWSGWMRKSGS